MFGKKSEAPFRDATAGGDWLSRRTDEVACDWRRVVGATLLLVAVWAAGMVAAMFLLIREIKIWCDALPAGAPFTLQQVMRDRPQVLLTSVAAGLAGLALMVAGLVVLRLILGRENWAPTKVLLFVASLPLFLILLGGVTTVVDRGTIALIVMPLTAGFALAMVPLELGVLAAALLRLALRQLRQRPVPVEDEDLPAAAAEYFQRYDTAAADAGLDKLGDFSYQPGWKKYRRFWIAPNGAYLFEATWASLGQSTLQAVCVFSATSDGRYFETGDHETDLGERLSGSDEPTAHLEMMPRASFDQLVERHIQLVTAWVAESGCRPLKFAAGELHALSLYGIAAHLSETRHALLWLGNPYLGQPLPPLPGKPWYPEDAAQQAPAAL